MTHQNVSRKTFCLYLRTFCFLYYPYQALLKLNQSVRVYVRVRVRISLLRLRCIQLLAILDISDSKTLCLDMSAVIETFVPTAT